MGNAGNCAAVRDDDDRLQLAHGGVTDQFQLLAKARRHVFQGLGLNCLAAQNLECTTVIHCVVHVRVLILKSLPKVLRGTPRTAVTTADIAHNVFQISIEEHWETQLLCDFARTLRAPQLRR